jgi:hypothetical protein
VVGDARQLALGRDLPELVALSLPPPGGLRPPPECVLDLRLLRAASDGAAKGKEVIGRVPT